MRQLARLAPPAPEPTDAGVAQRLAQWLNVADAITLHATHSAMAQPTPVAQPARGAAPPSLASLQQAVERTRQTLRASITRRERTLDTEYPLYHQRYQDQQRRMEMSLEALRDHVRQALGQTSPRLAQLAALDAVLGPLLAPREQRLLAGVPAFLKTRYLQLRTQHQQATADAETQAEAQAPLPLGLPVDPKAPWLAQFADEFEHTLLAELELRLQPILGMLEAYSGAAAAQP